jgi:hypothetical protein
MTTFRLFVAGFVLFLSLILFTPSFLFSQNASPIELGSKLELFVDNFLIDSLDGASLVMHHPRDEGEVLKFYYPWEGAFCGYATVIKDGDLYRLYYRGLPKAGKDGSPNETTCYAESKDGVHWEKPELGIYEIMGRRDNNVILANAAPATHNFSPFLDVNPNADPKYRFKALGGTRDTGLFAFMSEDGVHWKKLREESVFKDGIFDSQNVAFWSEAEQRYICYFRTWSKDGYNGWRSVSRATSPDFINWSAAEAMTFGDTQREHLYTNQTHPYFRAPHLYVAIAARFMPNRQVLTDAQAENLGVNPKYFKDCSDAVLMTSRGGTVYDRTFMEGFITPDIGMQNWVSRTNYPALNVVQTGPTEMSVYVNQNYAQPTACLHRYSMRLDGFASLHAPYSGGEMITKPLTFNGENLFLNYATSAAGEIRIEIQDESGVPIPGFTFDEAQPVIGNEIERAYSWNGEKKLSDLAGASIRLRFVLKDAHVYSLNFK